ncbi:hypothetical protein [Aureimonas ureilytica]|uniref:hypothetical protein n=1 Tax=Aureimonas ureilytica TaxID=401562 RepID=UPI0003A95586|nr:hypothetical protein [Aureimonas ureilytica]
MTLRLVRSALLGLALAAGVWAPSQAASIDAPVQTVQYRGDRPDGWRGDRGPRDWHERRGPRDWHHDRRGWREDRHGRRDGICRPGLALEKAARMGVRRGDIVRVSPRGVTVAGFRRGHPVAVRFAQVRGCPVIGMR